MRIPVPVPKQRREGRIAQIETARKCAECWQHAARGVGDKTPAPDRAGPPGDSRNWMKMAGDLTGGGPGARFMPEGDPANQKFISCLALNAARQNAIVIAGDPDPFAPRLQRADHRVIARGKALTGFAVVKRIAQRHDRARLVNRDEICEQFQRCRRIVRRQKNFPRSEGRAFLEMKIGDDEKPLLAPKKRACGIHDKFGVQDCQDRGRPVGLAGGAGDGHERLIFCGSV